VIARSECPADAEADNPFHADGELRRKADFIITHSRISRTQLHIADPDHDLTATTNATISDAPSDNTDGPLTAAASSTSTQQHHSRHDDETTVVAVTSSVTSPLHASTAETIRIKKKRCVVQ